MTEKILVVDDDPDIRDVLRITLEAEGYEVFEAADGSEVLPSIKKHGPHLILLDFVMPKMNGFEVSAMLRKDILLRHIPIIML
ncbi:MAG: response regulator, partial [Candidatus Omnitrophota bacterium]